MSRVLLVVVGILFLAHGALAEEEFAGFAFRDGDIILQTSRSSQSEAIQLATNSRWTHVGIVIHREGVAYVYEAHGPVGYRRLDSFIAGGVGGKYLVRRYRKPLTAADLGRLRAAGLAFLGRPYDPYFAWDDSQLYCSELVWKIFDRGLGVSVGGRQKLGAFNLSHPRVKKIRHARYGATIPKGETVVSPAAIATSSALKTVFRN